jgi:squalene/oxidosqualene cyclase-like protein
MELILSMQNADGGWATYELTRGPAWLELFNPSDCFRNIMIDYSYVECTSACVQALAAFRARYKEESVIQIEGAIARGRDFLLKAQRADGSFEGAWGVCFTYGCWFGVNGLKASGLNRSESPIRRVQSYLVGKQNRDGGWGESVENCSTRIYDSQTESQVVMTSWAVLALLETDERAERSIERGIEFLVARQLGDGSYQNEKSAGVFNKTCAITYDNYLKIFPIWALSQYLNKKGSVIESKAVAAE